MEIGPGPAEEAAEQLPAAGQAARADSEMIKDSSHKVSRYGRPRPEP